MDDNVIKTNDKNEFANQESPRANRSSEWGLWIQNTFSILLGILIGVGLGYLLWGHHDTSSPVAVVSTPTVQETQSSPLVVDRDQIWKQMETVKRYSIPEGTNPILGPADAPVTIIEFSDYQCPYCQKFHNESFAALRQKYSDKIRFAYRDFPLTQVHLYALSGATAARCAGDQEKYWEYGDLLFSKGVPQDQQGLVAYATQLGLDTNVFTQCLTSNKYNAAVQKDQEEAANLGTQSTPTFFVNGIPVIGAQPIEVFEAIIDYELAHPKTAQNP